MQFLCQHRQHGRWSFVAHPSWRVTRRLLSECNALSPYLYRFSTVSISGAFLLTCLAIFGSAAIWENSAIDGPRRSMEDGSDASDNASTEGLSGGVCAAYAARRMRLSSCGRSRSQLRRHASARTNDHAAVCQRPHHRATTSVHGARGGRGERCHELVHSAAQRCGIAAGCTLEAITRSPDTEPARPACCRGRLKRQAERFDACRAERVARVIEGLTRRTRSGVGRPGAAANGGDSADSNGSGGCGARSGLAGAAIARHACHRHLHEALAEEPGR